MQEVDGAQHWSSRAMGLEARPMADPSPESSSRLDQIKTRWSLVRLAHAAGGPSADEARRMLVLRYSPSIHRYVRMLTGNDERADDLAHDVVVRMLSGDFGGADPNRGRFRDLLKTAVRNMVFNEYRRKLRCGTVSLRVDEVPEKTDPSREDPWLETWRRNLLDLTWQALESYQASHPGSVAYTLLRLRTKHPEESSEQLAARLSELAGGAISANTARQQLRRARTRFAELLVEEMADALDHATADRIEDELIALGLYYQVRDALPPGWQANLVPRQRS